MPQQIIPNEVLKMTSDMGGRSAPPATVAEGGVKWTDLKVSTPSGDKEILHTMSGHVTPGTLCCILGPSGAGKTTLTNALCARVIKGVDGKIEIASTDSTFRPLE